MLDKEITWYIYRILSGMVEVSIQNNTYYIVQPSFLELAKAEEIYHQTVRKLTLDGGISQAELSSYLIDYNLWSVAEQEELDNFSSKLEDLKVELYNSFLNFSNVNLIRQKISKLKERYNILSNKIEHHTTFTIEGTANVEKMKYKVLAGLRNADLSTPDASLLLQLKNSFVEELIGAYVSKIINYESGRQIAKSNEWRRMWSDFRTLSQYPFTTNLTTDQSILIYWSRYYDNIYEASEHPAESVIDDDDMIDGWYALQIRKMNKDKQENMYDKSRYGNANEIFVVADSEESAQRVHSMNSQQADMLRKQRLSMVNKHGNIEEQKMPDSLLEIRSQAMENERQRFK